MMSWEQLALTAYAIVIGVGYAVGVVRRAVRAGRGEG
jgi:hypothetical protein